MTGGGADAVCTVLSGCLLPPALARERAARGLAWRSHWRPPWSLTKLNFRNMRVGDDGLVRLADVLKRPLSLTRLSLRSNGLTGAGLAPLVRALRVCDLLRLDLSGNALGSSAAAQIAGAMDALHFQLQWLHLGSCALTDNGAQLDGVVALSTALGVSAACVACVCVLAVV